MGFLEKVSSKDRNIYWCYKEGSSANEQIERLLERYNGFKVPIDNFDDTMQLFGEAFGFDFSTEIESPLSRTAKEPKNANYYHKLGFKYFCYKRYGKAIQRSTRTA